MKKILLYVLAVAALLPMASACKDDDKDTWDSWREWREQNEAWLEQLAMRRNADGTPYYHSIVAPWDPSAYVLIHYFNDRKLTEGNLVPMSTSVTDTRYILHLKDDIAVDSSTNVTTWGKRGIYRSQVNKNIEGWTIAMTDMHVGDTAEVVIPYQQGYGDNTSSAVPPYSVLRFNLRLADIYRYETSPY